MGILKIERDLRYGTITVSQESQPTFQWLATQDMDSMWDGVAGITSEDKFESLSSKNVVILKTYKVNSDAAITYYCGDTVINLPYTTGPNYEQGTILHFYACINGKIVEDKQAMVDFEDILISDDKRTLRVAYNPKFSAIKSTIMESKTETLGAQFPFFFRNGAINYKEFNVGGLLSYIDRKDLARFDAELASEYDSRFGVLGHRNSTTARPQDSLFEQNANDIYLERKFKRKVEEWLNNGEPKLIRTATEGNFKVRLMNVNLTPTDQLGRKLHAFEATAYEIENWSAPKVSGSPVIVETSQTFNFTVNDNGIFPHAAWRMDWYTLLPSHLSFKPEIKFTKLEGTDTIQFIYNKLKNPITLDKDSSSISQTLLGDSFTISLEGNAAGIQAEMTYSYKSLA